VRATIVAALLASCAPEIDPAPSSPSVPRIDADAEVAADIRRYVRALESRNAAVCLDAVDYLPYFGRAAVPDLVAELGSTSANGRALAAATLGRIPDARAVGGADRTP
jgi:hypothetical protein